MKVQVTVEMEFNKLPDDAAKDLARELVEARGFNVSRVAIAAERGRAKAFVPKAGKPGSVLIRGGIAYTVWGDSHMRGHVWATREDSNLYYLVGERTAEPFHADGREHRQWNQRCDHPSHERDNAA